MPKTTDIEIRVLDLPGVKAELAAARAEIEQLRRERDEWEERYEWLLGECGGTSPR